MMPEATPINGGPRDSSSLHTKPKLSTREQRRKGLQSNSEPPAKHIVFVSTHFRSHFRPFFFTALSLTTQYKHIYITIYVANEVLAIVDEERALFFSPQGESTVRPAALQALDTPGVEEAGERVRVIGFVSDSRKSSPSENNRSGTSRPPFSLHEGLKSAEWSSRFQVVYERLPSELLAYQWPRDVRANGINSQLHGPSGTNGRAKAEHSATAILREGGSTFDVGHATQSNADGALAGFAAPPTSLCFDFLLDIPRTLEKIAQTGVGSPLGRMQLIAYSPGPAAWALRRLKAPDIAEKLASVEKVFGESAELTEASAAARICEILTHTNGSIVNVEGCYQCYDYELMPQLGSMHFDWAKIYLVYKAAQNMLSSHGVMFSTLPELEPGVDALLQEALGRPVFQIGPQLPLHWWTEMADKEAQETDKRGQHEPTDEVQQFLDSALQRHGRKSVLFISFGSVYSMEKRPDLLDILIRILLDINSTGVHALPFVFATTTTSAMISQEVRRLVEASGCGLFCHFAPQHLILRHPATGWFLTHGGANGIHESIISRVPMILWPATTDQPVTAAQIATNLGCGIELIQVRTGPSTGQRTMRGTQHLGGSKTVISNELKTVLSSIVESRLDPEKLSDAAQHARTVRAATNNLADAVMESHCSPMGRCKIALDAFARFL